jgi:hypothetical protein
MIFDGCCIMGAKSRGCSSGHTIYGVILLDPGVNSPLQ